MQLQAELEQAQKWMDAIATIDTALSKLGSDDQRKLLALLLAQRMSQETQTELTPSIAPQQPPETGGEQSPGERALRMMAERNGVTVAELAKTLYPEKTSRAAKHAARSVLRYLKQRSRARVLHGKWRATARATTPSNSKNKRLPGPDTIAGRVLRIVAESTAPIASGSIKAAILKLDPDTDRRSIYAAVYHLIGDGLLVATEVEGGKVHSLAKGVTL